MRTYLPLYQQTYSFGNYKLIPIRHEDRHSIRQWRNDQIDILRQNEPLTEAQQDNYFNTVINQLFEQAQPSQLLFSFLENNKLIGYGGLVHINWEKKTAEISFLTPHERAINAEIFVSDWCNYLKQIKQIGDIDLNFNSLFTYAYNIRPLLYNALSQSGFKEKERIKNAVSIANKNYDVLIHEYIFQPISFKMADKADLMQYYTWANDQEVRENSYNQQAISLQDHSQWFETQIENTKNYFYLFLNNQQQAIGQVRISIKTNENIIGVSVDYLHRGKGFSAKMIAMASHDFMAKNKGQVIVAYIKTTNMASYQSFIKAGYIFKEKTMIENNESYALTFASII